MGQRKRIEIGKATDLHFGSGRGSSHPKMPTLKKSGSGGAPHLTGAVPMQRAGHDGPHAGGSAEAGHQAGLGEQPHPTMRKATAADAARGVRRVVPQRSSGALMEAGLSGRATKVALGVAVVAVVAIAVAGCWWFLWRSVGFTVNGQEVSARIGSRLVDVIEAGDYYGAKAGRLLSVNGNVIDEQGGTRFTLSIDGEEIDLEGVERIDVPEGAEVGVGDGVDVTEDHTEQTVEVAPTVQMERGGAIQYVSQWGKPGKKVIWTGKASGETVDHEVLEQPVDMVIAGRNLSPSKADGKKHVALTFDDGPSAYTPQILDILKQKGVKATFYNLGAQALAYPEYAKRVVDEGHELASHTNKHQYLPNLDRDSLRAEIGTAAESLKKVTGEDVQMIRAPYGAFDANSWLRSADLISCNVLWNIDTRDWERPGAQAIVNSAVNGAYNGAIVLMHDGGGNREQDVEALPAIIDGLRAAGFEPVTVRELMELDGEIPTDVVKGAVKQPKDAVIPAEG
ncbi:MAG: polysaccharide deacetylase family protein [Coriobacteriaceae bacterium]|nr:polysaccharide deacetylase family protein [Coriobacteriaceae bacterium]